MRGSRGCFTAHPPAAVSGYGIEPERKSLGILELGQVPERTGENLLHVIFRVLPVAADLHTEGIDRILQQTDRLFNGFSGIARQEFGSLDRFGSHRWGS